MVSGTMTIPFYSANLGSLSDNVGMNNIAFNQGEAATVALPTALPLFATALACPGLVAAQRRRPHHAQQNVSGSRAG